MSELTKQEKKQLKREEKAAKKREQQQLAVADLYLTRGDKIFHAVNNSLVFLLPQFVRTAQKRDSLAG